MRTLAMSVLLAGCVVQIEPNERPRVVWAEATCGTDRFGSWNWTFDARIVDGDSPWDVVSVDAHVYDNWWGWWVDSFALDRTDDPEWWSATWAEWSTALYCGDPYLIDFVATDTSGASSVYTVAMSPWFY